MLLLSVFTINFFGNGTGCLNSFEISNLSYINIADPPNLSFDVIAVSQFIPDGPII
jgi:hypothetical protein